MIEVETWVEGYRRAWETADAEGVADLFSDSATYRSNIFEEPHVGREGIMSYWSGVTSTQKNVTVEMGRPIVQGNRVAVEFWTTMENDGALVTLPGSLLLLFDDEGKCLSLHEYYTFAEGRLGPPPEWGGHAS